MPEAVVRFEHISMEFPGVLANDDVSLDIRQGEVFALVGSSVSGRISAAASLISMQTQPNYSTFIIRYPTPIWA